MSCKPCPHGVMTCTDVCILCETTIEEQEQLIAQIRKVEVISNSETTFAMPGAVLPSCCSG